LFRATSLKTSTFFTSGGFSRPFTQEEAKKEYFVIASLISNLYSSTGIPEIQVIRTRHAPLIYNYIGRYRLDVLKINHPDIFEQNSSCPRKPEIGQNLFRTKFKVPQKTGNRTNPIFEQNSRCPRKPEIGQNQSRTKFKVPQKTGNRTKPISNKMQGAPENQKSIGTFQFETSLTDKKTDADPIPVLIFILNGAW
jgi:hypothetical protein